MISVVIPTLDSAAGLAATLTSLVPAAVEGLVREVIVVDGGSTDQTLAVADGAGADVVMAEPGRSGQLRTGARAARFPWLLFLLPDTELDRGWEREASQFMERVDSGRRPVSAAVFRFAVDDEGFAPRALEALAAFSARLLKLPHGRQGLLIPRSLYDEVGGHRILPLMEDFDLARRLKGRRLAALRTRAVTSALRYRSEGYWRPIVVGQVRLGLYLLRVPVSTIASIAGGGEATGHHVASGSLS